MKYRVIRSAPPAFDPPCPCSDREWKVIWEGISPRDYTEGLGCFDEGCHHPQRVMEAQGPNGDWLPVREAQRLWAHPCSEQDWQYGYCGSCGKMI